MGDRLLTRGAIARGGMVQGLERSLVKQEDMGSIPA